MDDIFEMTLAELDTVASSEQFVIDTDVKAEWALHQIAEVRAESKRIIDTSEQYASYYLNRIQQEKERCEARCKSLEALLKGYFDTVPHKESKTQKSYNLPSGKLVLKDRQPEIKLDNEALTSWLVSNDPDFVETKLSPKWGEFKKTLTLQGTDYLTKYGEVVPGITVTPREPEFTVSVK